MDIAKKDYEEGNSQIVLYQPNETISIEVKLDVEYDTVWLSIDQMAQLFGRDKSVIGKHVRAVFKDGELQKDSVWAKFAYTASDGKTYQVDYYNLDLIISVGYRVKSVQGTQFRVWATGVLRKYLLQGYSISRHLVDLQEHMDRRMSRLEDVQARQQEHDRWLVIDDKLYHCGHSLNANGGHKISAITLMGTSPEVILGQVR